jgi:hypothetical protein
MSTQAASKGNGLNPNSPSGQISADQREHVYTVISGRWPTLSQEELRKRPFTVDELANYISEKVDSARSEIESVVSEALPKGASAWHAVVDPITQRAHQASEHVTGSVHSAIERIQYEVDEAPLKTSLATFVLGFGLGVLATTLYFQSRPQPSSWEQLKSLRLYGRH